MLGRTGLMYPFSYGTMRPIGLKDKVYYLSKNAIAGEDVYLFDSAGKSQNYLPTGSNVFKDLPLLP